ncbi:MAG: chromosomal replication initiator protein DnaA [Oscillospiraceae bacterium]|nr:chromosomal replication initiator protein DnaA [Oscillospiraceae bacterium]
MYSTAYIWGKIVAGLETRLTEPVVNAWFGDAEVIECTDSRLVLYSPTEFQQEMIRKYSGHIQDAMKEFFDNAGDVEVVVLGDSELKDYRSHHTAPAFLEFNPNFTFEKFVVGSSNRFAHAAALAVATNPAADKTYNPLFLYGPSGLGKTHLLFAIASKVHKEHPDFNIVYVKAEQFTNELIAAIQNQTNSEFRSKYRSADLLLVDDIQFIAGKDSTQEEYFHTFNDLYEHSKQIVMTADRPAYEMKKLDERLNTRFSWGMTTEISPPDYETRMAILRNNAMQAGLDFPNEVCAFFAENITTDVRKLEGAVNMMKAAKALDGQNVDMALAQRVLKNIKPDGKALATPSLIIAEVCSFYSLDEPTLRSTAKTKVVSEARQVVMYLMQKKAGYSTPEIGRELDRDHSTVLYGINKVAQLLKDRNSGLQDNIRDIEANIDRQL